jgi:hypothetical protein
MKKIILATAMVTIGSFFMSANAGNTYSKTDRETRRQIRRERRAEREEWWLHSTDPATLLQFYSDFPGAKDISWKEGAFAEASFLDDGILKTAYYDTDSKLVGTTAHVDFSALPEKAQQKINKKYPGFYTKDVIFFDDNEVNETDMNLWATSFEDEDNYFPVLSDGSKEVILKVTMDGDVSLFHEMK